MYTNLNQETLLKLENAVFKSPTGVIYIDDLDFVAVNKKQYEKMVEIINNIDVVLTEIRKEK